MNTEQRVKDCMDKHPILVGKPDWIAAYLWYQDVQAEKILTAPTKVFLNRMKQGKLTPIGEIVKAIKSTHGQGGKTKENESKEVQRETKL